MTTPNLALPLLSDSQSQKHVTVNEALAQLDGIVQLSVISSTETAPPASPAEGDRYIVAASATGSWAGWDASVALYSGGAWLQLVPQTGWLAWDQAAGELLTYDSASGWAALSTGSSAGTGGISELPLVNGDFETGDATGWTVTVGAAAVADWSTMAGYDSAGATVARNGTYVFSGGEGTAAQAQVTAHQDVDISSDGSALYWLTADLLKNYADSDTPTITFEILDAAGALLDSASAAKSDGTVGISPVILSLARPANAATARITLDVTRNTGTNNNGAIDNVVLLGSGDPASATPAADQVLARSASGAEIGVHIAEELLTGLSGASVTSTITIPDRAIVLAVSTRTVTAITGATSYDCGIAGDTAKFGGSLGIAAGSTNVGAIGPQAFYAATPIVLTANGGSFTGGDVRIAIQYLLPTAPSA